MPISKIKTSGIEDSAVTSSQLGDNSVTSAKIGVDVIVAEDIANNAITVAELADDAVTNAKLADGAVTSAKLDTNIDVAGTLDVTGDLTADSGVKLPTASGGVYTITGTDTATNRSLTLPDEAGTVLTSASDIPSSSITGLTQGITGADVWRLTTTLTTQNATLTNLEQPDTANPGVIGSSMSVSSGVFTFPSTGIWLIMMQVFIISDGDNSAACIMKVSTDGGSNFNVRGSRVDGGNTNAGEKRASVFGQFILDVTSTANIKVRFDADSLVGSEIIGDTNENLTSFSFIRLGDT